MTSVSDLIRRVRRHEMTGQFVRYAAVGCLNVVVFFGTFNLLTPAHSSKLRTTAAYIIGFLLTSVISFVLNKLWAFKDSRRDRIAHQYALFLGLTIVGLGLQLGIFSLLLVPLETYGRLGRNIATVPGIPISVLWNFTAYRRWTFNSVTAAVGGPGSV